MAGARDGSSGPTRPKLTRDDRLGMDSLAVGPREAMRGWQPHDDRADGRVRDSARDAETTRAMMRLLRRGRGGSAPIRAISSVESGRSRRLDLVLRLHAARAAAAVAVSVDLDVARGSSRAAAAKTPRRGPRPRSSAWSRVVEDVRARGGAGPRACCGRRGRGQPMMKSMAVIMRWSASRSPPEAAHEFTAASGATPGTSVRRRVREADRAAQGLLPARGILGGHARRRDAPPLAERGPSVSDVAHVGRAAKGRWRRAGRALRCRCASSRPMASSSRSRPARIAERAVPHRGLRGHPGTRGAGPVRPPQTEEARASDRDAGTCAPLRQ
jgi:hypothetical protein